MEREMLYISHDTIFYYNTCHLTDLVLRVDEEVDGAAGLLPDDGDAVALLELVEVAAVVVDDGGAVVHDAVARHHPRARAQVRHRRREVEVVRRVRRHACKGILLN